MLNLFKIYLTNKMKTKIIKEKIKIIKIYNLDLLSIKKIEKDRFLNLKIIFNKNNINLINYYDYINNIRVILNYKSNYTYIIKYQFYIKSSFQKT